MSNTTDWRQHSSIESDPETMACLPDVRIEGISEETTEAILERARSTSLDGETPRVETERLPFELTEIALSSLLFLADVEIAEKTNYESEDRERIIVSARHEIHVDGLPQSIEAEIQAGGDGTIRHVSLQAV